MPKGIWAPMLYTLRTMGATYCSIQAHTTDRGAVLTCARSFAGKHPDEFQCYVGEALGQWTAVYPSFSAVMDPFAKELSQALGCLVLTLASADEDEVLCNFCLAGKNSYDYILRNDYSADLDRQVELVKIG